MKIITPGFHNSSFKGAKAPSVDAVKNVVKIVNCNFDGIVAKLTDKIQKHTPDLVENVDGAMLLKKTKPFQSFLESLSAPFIQFPKKLAASVSGILHKTFPNNELFAKLVNSSFITKYKLDSENRVYERAVRGIYEYGNDFVEEALAKKGLQQGQYHCHQTCSDVVNKFYKRFNDHLSSTSPKYNTRDERAGVRFFSASVAALALGKDFFNKAKRDGATDAEANKEARTKIKQEMIAGVGETYSQFAILGGFPRYINNSQFGAPIISTLLGLFFNITSRLQTKRPLARIKIQEKIDKKLPSLNEFADAANKGEKPGLKQEAPQNKKKPLLSLKNIALACLAGVAAGFALRYTGKGLSKTTIGQNFNKFVDSIKENIREKTVGQRYITKADLESFYKTLNTTKNNKMFNYYKGITDAAFQNSPDGRIFLGEYNKTVKFLGLELSKKDLMQIPLAPLKLIKEIASYPYKAVCKILEQLKVKGFEGKPRVKLKDPYEMLNVLMDFEKHSKRFAAKGKEAEFIDFYSKHLTKNALQCVDKFGNSKVDNAKIGKLTQLLGTITSIYFATTDDYNRTAERTGNKQRAEKDARERGLNKAFRIVSQIVMMDIFNGVFKIPYTQNLLGAFGVTTACTLATDALSRTLTGMPNRKMSVEELKAFEENKKKSIAGGYYKVIDKLSG